jgi:hypothetical protein
MALLQHRTSQMPDHPILTNAYSMFTDGMLSFLGKDLGGRGWWNARVEQVKP